MVLVIAQLRLSLVLSQCHSFGLFIRCLFSSLPVPLPVNIRLLDIVSFSSLPIPFPNNICLIVCSLISSLPDPFPDNSVLLFVWICLVLIYACPRLRLLPKTPAPSPCDSRLRPTPVHWTCLWITLSITVCQRTILDCCLSLEVCFNKEHYFFAPEFCLAIGSCYRILTHSVHFIDNFNIFWQRDHLFGADGLHLNKATVSTIRVLFLVSVTMAMVLLLFLPGLDHQIILTLSTFQSGLAINGYIVAEEQILLRVKVFVCRIRLVSQIAMRLFLLLLFLL